jgi:organic radical activating enzyme
MLPTPAANAAHHVDADRLGEGLRFLWLELTNKCNLICAHCYAESGPHPTRKDVLTTSDYDRLLEEGAALGCRAVQFIGGEPTLHRGLPELIAHARALGYEDVEVYTNGTVLPDTLLSCFVENRVSIAASVYADYADVHDAVTGRTGSHRRTIANLRRMVDADLDIRVGVITMDVNQDRVDATVSFLRELGIENVGIDHARGVGRGGDVCDGESGLQALCGQCWQGSLCVASDATVSPCIMAKAWPVGSTAHADLAELVNGPRLREVRELIRTEVWAAQQDAAPGQLCSPQEMTLCSPKEKKICNPQDPKQKKICNPPDPKEKKICSPNEPQKKKICNPQDPKKAGSAQWLS